MRATDAQVVRCPGCGAWSMTGRACDVCLTLFVYGPTTTPVQPANRPKVLGDQNALKVAPRCQSERSRGMSDQTEERKTA